MAQWEDKLGTILNDPQAMSRIMALAQSLEGGQEPEAPPEEVSSAPAPEPVGPAPDPRLMEAAMGALSAWNGPNDRRTALLEALRPFLKEERQGKLDKAVRITRLSAVVRRALDTFQGGEDDL